MHKNIFIIGPLGAGKSSVGFHIAKKLHMTFYDSDREVEQRSGVDIDWMFEVEGEAGFRSREQQVISDLTAKHNVVIATGGGTVMIPECRTLLKERGTIIYLQVSFTEQLQRVQRFPAKRPEIQSNPEAKLAAYNKECEDLYASLADLTYLNTNKHPAQLAYHIIKDIKKI